MGNGSAVKRLFPGVVLRGEGVRGGEMSGLNLLCSEYAPHLLQPGA